LPGNVLLQGELQRRVEQDQPFALVYIDLDNFKAFNDVYGFARGDRAIHLLASVLADNAPQDAFLGHIGGDDFAMVYQGAAIEELCQQIITVFDKRVRDLYDAVDLRRGYLETVDRHGVMRQFGLLSLSISVVRNRDRQFSSVDEIGKVAAELKNAAKQTSGSSYVIDRRRSTENELQEDRRGQHRPTALLIDPDELVRTALATTLRLQGYRPLIAGDLVAAQGLLARIPEPTIWVVRTDNAQIWNLWESMVNPPPLIAVAKDAQTADAARVRGAIAAVVVGDNPVDLADQLLLSLPQVIGAGGGDPGEAQAALIRELRTRTAQLERAAYQDSLTGLANRRLFEQTFAEMIDDCRERQQPICLALISIDHLNNSADTQTATSNASVIATIVETLQRLKRPDDMVARYDNREFALALPATYLSQAIEVCEAIRVAVEEDNNPFSGSKTRTTLSIGLADHRNDETPQQLFSITDRLLVEAGDTGGNRVHWRSSTHYSNSQKG
jgi:diguanylate cyclase (GGDEF)-like protein